MKNVGEVERIMESEGLGAEMPPFDVALLSDLDEDELEEAEERSAVYLDELDEV